MEEGSGGVYSSKEDCQKQQALNDSWLQVKAAGMNSENSAVRIEVLKPWHIKRSVFPGLKQETPLG